MDKYKNTNKNISHYVGFQEVMNSAITTPDQGRCFENNKPTKQIYNTERPEFNLCGSQEACVYKKNITHKTYCTFQPDKEEL